MAPLVLDPVTPTSYQFLYNSNTAGVSCTFSARPVVDNSIVQWLWSGGDIEEGPYTLQGQPTTVTETYGWDQGWISQLQFDTQQTPFTCEYVSAYDGNYTCTVDDGFRYSTSQHISAMALCKFIINLTSFI